MDDTPTASSIADKDRPFSPQEEEDIVHWLSQNMALYNAATVNWKGGNTKEELIQMQANDMGVQFRILNKWIIIQTNYYTKLTGAKSGQTVKFATEKQQWILDHFSFMRPFIC